MMYNHFMVDIKNNKLIGPQVFNNVINTNAVIFLMYIELVSYFEYSDVLSLYMCKYPVL